VLTGANGSGKTTILNILGQHFDWYSQFLRLPKSIQTSAFRYLSDLRVELGQEREQVKDQVVIGQIVYDDDTRTDIGVPISSTEILYGVQLRKMKAVQGLFLPSHRSMSAYQQVEWIPATFSATSHILQQYVEEVRSRYSGHTYGSKKSALLLMKEALLAAAIYSEGNSSVTPIPEAEHVWTGFQDTLRALLPASIGFRRLTAQPPLIIVETDTGTFPIDAVSGGLSAILELGWQIFLRSRDAAVFTVCIDEPENHLHPSLQRAIIPSLLKAFPSVAFIVATHSPFIVTSAPDAHVYVLRYDEEQAVTSVLLDFREKAASAEATLRQVLGVYSTLPVWAEERFDEIINRYLGISITPELLSRLRRELASSGLDVELPDAVDKVIESQDGTNSKRDSE